MRKVLFFLLVLLFLGCQSTSPSFMIWGYLDYDLDKYDAETKNIKTMAAGDSHVLILKTDGKVSGWGDNQYGQIDIPPDLENVKAIAASTNYSVALKEDGSVVVWGWHSNDNLKPPTDLPPIKYIAAGPGMIACISVDGQPYTWGVSGTEISLPEHKELVKVSIGLGYCYFLDIEGQIFYYDGPEKPFEFLTPADLAKVKDIVCGSEHVVALLEDGTVTVWFSQYINAQEKEALTPPDDLTDVKEIATGYDHIVVLKNNGRIVTWGNSAQNVPKFLPKIKSIFANYMYSIGIVE